ncbi:hypothetical protein A6A25_11885 [Saccharothrix sp. CB00851]|nr:hypothetical protein A6A25_11885 [Saccharothrix sp. CB00851]
MRQLRRLAEKVLAQRNELTLWQSEGIPEPAVARESRPAGEEDEGSAGSRGPRKVLVVRLMAQVPHRAWKVRELANHLKIDNVKSLRVSLDDAVREGVLKRIPTRPTFSDPMRGIIWTDSGG